MEFGVFDHLDRGELPLPAYYEARLKLIELYDRSGFYAYHLAEHHATPIGMAPSPSVFLAAVAQRTRRLRFGPLVYLLPFYHPLRLLEEICMLDQMSGGRLEFGLGRGISPMEAHYYGVDHARAQAQFEEAFEVILRGLRSEELSFVGEFYRFDAVPMQMTTLQRPHPPLWYGLHSPESAERAANRGFNMVSLDGIDLALPTGARFREVWDAASAGREPKIGLCRFIVVADTDAEGIALARRAYAHWLWSFSFLMREKGAKVSHGERPDADAALADGRMVAGSAETVERALRAQLSGSAFNYLIGQFAFGDQTPAETTHSVSLFVDRVMPALQRATASSR